jgi:hypothetical protein
LIKITTPANLISWLTTRWAVLKGQVQFAAAIPAHWGDDDLAELIFLPLEKRENRSYPTWEIPTRDHGSATLFKFWKRERAP